LDSVLRLACVGADSNRVDVFQSPEYALREKEPERELDVIARRAHDDRQRLALEQQLEWLLHDNDVRLVGPGSR
jgi:hypothetical protein